MPRKATGGKNGRPKKYKLTEREEWLIDYCLSELEKSNFDEVNLTAAAKIVGKSRQAVSKMVKHPFFQRVFQSKLTDLEVKRAAEQRQLDKERDEAIVKRLLERLDARETDRAKEGRMYREATIRIRKNPRPYFQQFVFNYSDELVKQGYQPLSEPQKVIDKLVNDTEGLPLDLVDEHIKALKKMT